jgi:hypothetical protein
VKWQNKELFMELINRHLLAHKIHPELQESIKMHAIACFNYLSVQPKKKNEVKARKIFLQRLLFEASTMEDVKAEIHQYLQGISTYSQSCFGGASGDIKSRIACAYNLGLFKSLQNNPSLQFEHLPRKERKRIVSMV